MTKLEEFYITVVLISVYVCTFSVIFGCLASFISIVVFWHPKNKKPKIGAKDYLTILTVVNSIYLIINWYSITTQYIIHHYEIKPSNFFSFFVNLKNTNNLVCKFVNFSLSSTRCSSTFLTLMFSMERALAIYFPFKLRRYNRSMKNLSLMILCFLFIFCNLISLHAFISYEIVVHNLTRVSSSLSEQKLALCSIKDENVQRHNYVSFYVAIFTSVVPFFLIILANLAIVLQLKRTKNVLSIRSGYFHFPTLTMTNTNSTANPNLNTDTPISGLTRNSTNNLIVRDANFNVLNDRSSSVISESNCKTDMKSCSMSGCVRFSKSSATVTRTASFDTIVNDASTTSNLTNTQSILAQNEENQNGNTLRQLFHRVKKQVWTQNDNKNNQTIKKTNRPYLLYQNNRKVLIFRSDSRQLSTTALLKKEDSLTQTGLTNNRSISSGSSGNSSSVSRGLSTSTKFAVSTSEKDLSLRCANKKIHSTKILITLTSFYIFLNLPHLVNIFLIHVPELATRLLAPYLGKDELDSNNDNNDNNIIINSSDKIHVKYIYEIVFIVFDIFNMFNYSISALLLFVSGKIYRRHLRICLFKFANFFKRLKNALFCQYS